MTKRVKGLVKVWRGRIKDTRTDDEYQLGLEAAYEGAADDLEQALAADRAEAGELPELPAIQRVRVSSGSYPMVNDPAGDYVDYDDHVAAMRAYGQQCARAASCGGGEVVGYVAQDSLDELSSGRCVAVMMGTQSERHGRTIPVYTTPPPPSAGVEVTDAMVERAVEEIRKAKHTCFDRWTDHDAMRAALLAGVKVLLGEPVGYQWLDSGNFRKGIPPCGDERDWRPVYAPDLGGGK